MVYRKDLELQQKWGKLTGEIQKRTGKNPHDLNGMLFLIGVQELGKGRRDFSKEEKQDLIHIAICKLLSYAGYYELIGTDKDGWPHWKLQKNLPKFNLIDQEKLLKAQTLEYFKEEIGIEI